MGWLCSVQLLMTWTKLRSATPRDLMYDTRLLSRDGMMDCHYHNNIQRKHHVFCTRPHIDKHGVNWPQWQGLIDSTVPLWERRQTPVTVCRQGHPIEHKTFVQHLYNVGPASWTLGQRCANVTHYTCVFQNYFQFEKPISECRLFSQDIYLFLTTRQIYLIIILNK